MLNLKNLLQLLTPSIPQDGNWHWCETTAGPVMRRRVNGQIDERPMTPAERDEYMASRAGW